MRAADGKMRYTDAADTEQMFRIIQKEIVAQVVRQLQPTETEVDTIVAQVVRQIAQATPPLASSFVRRQTVRRWSGRWRASTSPWESLPIPTT